MAYKVRMEMQILRTSGDLILNTLQKVLHPLIVLSNRVSRLHVNNLSGWLIMNALQNI